MDVKANFWYGASRYPIHESQEEEVRQLLDEPLRELVTQVVARMSKWSGGFNLKVEYIFFDIIGDGFTVNASVGDVQSIVKEALREAASD